MNPSHPNRAVFLGFLLVLPFVILNFIVALRLEPLFSALASAGFLTSTPWLPTLLLALFPIAFFVTIRPMLHKDATGRRRLYFLNSVLGALIFIAMILLWGGLGQDIIACDILKIPNCD